LQAAIWRPLIKCGQQSLEVFCVGIYLSFLASLILQTTSEGIWAQVLVGTVGLAIMTAVAYYRSWSKRVEKPVHAHANHPAADETHAPRTEPIQQHKPAAAGAV
jgi:hypothetical protein